ncbi:type II-A CRISPR-associated protein Csn2 [Lactobacillus sp. ESL0263]|uniref:type II-A CRISPR-associated protein Csn2 n=1 Tax=Lactobacillus sp. ESL0263 TaxID=2069350 RepID=UPI000EFCB97D|nr:type II-A CRISPR-associated protein Csn2 [Lactobacillus sp. ESL0263]RMC51504.1 type II-A CRISPR-associated protein Csn2 [Lactobacillus sp. ESL0263]
MILSYLTYKKWTLPDSGVTVITLQSPIAYRDLVQGFKKENSLLLCSDRDFNSLEITKTFDFVGDLLLSEDISKRYLTFVVNNYVKTIDEENRNKAFKAYYNLGAVLHDSLLLEDLPMDIDFNKDLKKLLKLLEIHFDRSVLTNPYATIETVLKIHQNYDLGTIPVFFVM